MSPSSISLLLVHPPSPLLLRGFSAGLISLGNFVAAQHPHAKIELLDLSESNPDDLEHAIGASLLTAGRAIVALTATTATYQSALRVARAAKRIRPDCVVVFGGHHAAPEATLVLSRHPEVDLVATGEGERTLAHIVGATAATMSQVPGLAFRDADGAVCYSAAPVPLSQAELDGLSPLWRGSALVGTPGKFGRATLVTARGCPLKCAFCAVGNQQIRGQSVAAVLRNAELMLSLGHHDLAIEDNFFARDPARTISICEGLSRLAGRFPALRWDCQTRVESLLRDDVIRALAGANCSAVYLGVESVVSDDLAYLRKTAQPGRFLAQLEESVVPRLIRSGVGVYLNLQFGLPGARSGSHAQAMNLLGRLGEVASRQETEIVVFPQLHVVYPGTPHFREYVNDGALAYDAFESFTEWEDDAQPVLRWLGEHFAHGVGGIPIGLLERSSLRASAFEPSWKSIEAVTRQIADISAIPGIRVFQYGKHLVER